MLMQPTNEYIVGALRAAGISEMTISVYVDQTTQTQDNLEYLASYWTQQITNKHIYTNQCGDICLFLRDTTSKMLWVDCFKRYVVPFLLVHRIME